MAGARDLRAAWRSRARVPGAQQPRRDRLLGRPLGRGGRSLPPRGGMRRARRQARRCRVHGRQHRRDPVRSGSSGRCRGALPACPSGVQCHRRPAIQGLRRCLSRSADGAPGPVRRRSSDARGGDGGPSPVRDGRIRRARRGVDRRSRGARRRCHASAGGREPADADERSASGRCSPAWPASRSRASASARGAMRELEHSLRTARDRGAEYDIAATIDAMAAIDGADPDPAARTGRDPRAAEDQRAARAGAARKRGVRAAGRRPSHPRCLIPGPCTGRRGSSPGSTRHDHVDSGRAVFVRLCGQRIIGDARHRAPELAQLVAEGQEPDEGTLSV